MTTHTHASHLWAACGDTLPLPPINYLAVDWDFLARPSLAVVVRSFKTEWDRETFDRTLPLIWLNRIAACGSYGSLVVAIRVYFARNL